MDVFSFLSQQYKVERKKVSISQIQKKMDLYPRVLIDTNTVRNYYEAMRSGEVFPPVVLTNDYVLIDGFHRVEASILLGRKEIDAVVIQNDLTKQEIFSLAVELNLRHGKRLTEKDIERVKSLISKEEVICFFSKYAESVLGLENVTKKIVLVKDDWGKGAEEEMVQALEELEKEGEEEGYDVFQDKREPEEDLDLEKVFEKKRYDFEEDFKDRFIEKDFESKYIEEEVEEEVVEEEKVGEGEVEEDVDRRDERRKGKRVSILEGEDDEKMIFTLYNQIEEIKKSWANQAYNLYGYLLALVKKVRSENREGSVKWVNGYIYKISQDVILFSLALLRDFFILTFSGKEIENRINSLENLKALVLEIQGFYKNTFGNLVDDNERRLQSTLDELLLNLEEKIEKFSKLKEEKV